MMQQNHLQTVELTLVSLMQSWCSSMHQLKCIHARAFRHGLHQSNTLIMAKLFVFSATSARGDIRYARLVFNVLLNPNVFFYNTMIRGYSLSRNPAETVGIFKLMKRNSVDSDGFTFPFILKACSRMPSAISEGQEIHVQVIKSGFQSYPYVQNGLIHLYAVHGITSSAHKVFAKMHEPDVVSWFGLVAGYVKAGELELAREVFDEMPLRDVVSWTSMINGYVKAKFPEKAIKLFLEMQATGIVADEISMISVISACSSTGDLAVGMSLHQYIEENGLGWMISLCNALIDMYAKCGSIERAQSVFEGMQHRSLITWNSMISALAMHGKSKDALSLFGTMKALGVRPDGVTFLAILSACTHRGLVDEVRRLFESMMTYRIEAGVEHYGCMVDLLGRAGLLEEAHRLVREMPIPSNDKVWGALLGACRIHGNAEIAEDVLKQLMLLKPDEGGYYALLANIYVERGQREDASKWREEMKAHEAIKNPGYTYWVCSGSPI